jgi:hypothetical protein
MDSLSKIRYYFIGWMSCLAWIPQTIIKEFLPDLDLWNTPQNPDDFLWYAERVNGRAAMLTVLALLCVEFLTKTSVLHLIHVL